ncbi:hypothetical protein HDE_09511 [Halotydeus destructor]|nr:hypothetical protein HDE_09511 [Halotydeus destructor]
MVIKLAAEAAILFSGLEKYSNKSLISRAILFADLLFIRLLYGMLIDDTGIIMYHIILTVLKTVNEEIIRSCSQGGAMSVETLQLRLSRVNHLKGLFDQSMSYYPSVWFVRLFIECLTISTSLVRRNMAWDFHVILHLYSTLKDVVYVACVILRADHADRCATNVYNQLVEELDGSESPEVRALVNKIGKTHKLNLTVWSMFKIDRDIFLTFTSAVVSFTVLFSQVASSW